MTQIGNKICALREARNLSKPELAKLLGVTPPAVYHMERGIRKPSIEMLIKLADLFEVSLDELTRLAAEPDEALEVAL